MIFLALLVVAFSFVFYTVDAWLFATAFYPAVLAGYDGLPNWWIVMPILTGLFAFGIGLGAWFGDYKTGREDVYGTLLLIATPFILIWSGVLDIFSASMIDYFFTGVFAAGWDIWWTWDWWWLNDPFNLGFGWSLSSWISGFLNLVTVPFWTVLLGAGIGGCLVTGLWFMYWKYA
jgi:hypothetical protein